MGLRHAAAAKPAALRRLLMHADTRAHACVRACVRAGIKYVKCSVHCRHVAHAAAAGSPVRLAACLIEPLIQGAGGMIQPDPLFQRVLVQACRARGMPIIFDEVCQLATSGSLMFRHNLLGLGVICSNAVIMLGMQPMHDSQDGRNVL